MTPTFDRSESDDPLVISMDVKEFADTLNRGDEKLVITERPTDINPRVMPTYIGFDGEDMGLRLLIATHPEILRKSRSMLTSSMRNARRAGRTLAKRIHRYSHGTIHEIESMCRDAGILDEPLRDAIKDTVKACDICSKSWQPAHSRKISLTHVNEEFNQ